MGDFLLGGVEFGHKEELMSCVYESFYMEYEPEFDTFVYKEQYDDSLHASILASLSSFPSPFHKALRSVSLSSSLKLKPIFNTQKYAFLRPNETFLMIIANNLNLDQETQVLKF